MSDKLLKDINSFEGYLDTLKNLTRHSIIIAACDTIVTSPTKSNIGEEGYKGLQALGLHLLRNDNVNQQFWSGYAAILSNGQVVYEKLAERNEDVRYDFTDNSFKIHILSSPYKNINKASIVVNGKDYAVNTRGLNIVVLDEENGSVVDSVSFDTWSVNKSSSRKQIQVEEKIEAVGENAEKEHYDVGIMGVWAGCNYGSIATYYALNQVISGMGHSVLMIDKPNIRKEDVEMQMTHSRIFANEHYNISKAYKIEELSELNDYCDAFVIGSDQVWNYGISRNFGKSYYLDYVQPGKKKIAYAASFGHGKDFASIEERRVISNLMNDFDAISVREADGVKISKDAYGIRAMQVLDPVFLADRKIFDELTDKSRFKITEKYVATYILDPTPEKVQLMRNVSERLGCKLVNMLDGLPWLFEANKKKLGLDVVEGMHVEEWLYIIKNCEFLITDSCHGASFGLLYNRRIIALTNVRRGVSRFTSLAELFDITDRVLTNPLDGIDNENLLKEMDYEKINEKLEFEKKRCYSWLRDALELPKEKLLSVKFPDKTVQTPSILGNIILPNKAVTFVLKKNRVQGAEHV